jgi:hypothetical protein
MPESKVRVPLSPPINNIDLRSRKVIPAVSATSGFSLSLATAAPLVGRQVGLASLVQGGATSRS